MDGSPGKGLSVTWEGAFDAFIGQSLWRFPGGSGNVSLKKQESVQEANHLFGIKELQFRLHRFR